MTIRLRRAQSGDETGFCRVKKNLPMPASDAAPRGGFLLGTNAETYRFFIENAFAGVLENAGEIIGFAIVLPDRLLRSSDLWKRKDEIEWAAGAPGDLIAGKLCYFEQLAVLPGAENRFYAAALALATLRRAFETHEAMFGTIVLKPVYNRASIRFLESVGGEKVGEANEFYPEFGALTSAVYRLDRAVFNDYLTKHPLKNKVFRQMETARAEISIEEER